MSSNFFADGFSEVRCESWNNQPLGLAIFRLDKKPGTWEDGRPLPRGWHETYIVGLVVSNPARDRTCGTEASNPPMLQSERSDPHGRRPLLGQLDQRVFLYDRFGLRHR